MATPTTPFKVGDIIVLDTNERSNRDNRLDSEWAHIFDGGVSRRIIETQRDSAGGFQEVKVEGTTSYRYAKRFLLAESAETVPTTFKAGDRVVLNPSPASDIGTPWSSLTAKFKDGPVTVERVEPGYSGTYQKVFLSGTDWWYGGRFVLAPVETPTTTPRDFLIVGFDAASADLILAAARSLGMNMESREDSYMKSDLLGRTFPNLRVNTRAETAYVRTTGYTRTSKPDDLTTVYEAKTDLPAILTALAGVAPVKASLASKLPASVGDYRLSVQANGDVKVGCTTVPAKLVAEIAAASAEQIAPAK